MNIPSDLRTTFNLNPAYECYDNSTLSTIDSCIRKAYWKLMFTLPNAAISGVQERVGIAAHFGSSIHSAMDKFYSSVLYKTQTIEQRRIAALRAFSVKYAELIPEHELVEEPYTHSSGIRLLDSYYSHYESEDQFFVPIDTEICIIVLVDEIDPPFYWIARADGNIYRPAMSDYLVREFKTTKSSLQNKIDELRISRQVEGYVWAMREADPSENISGVMVDVLAARVRERDNQKLFAREIFHITPAQTSMWKQETIAKVKRWREIKAHAEKFSTEPLNQHHFFDRSTNECLRYGKCSYYKLCVYGLGAVDLREFAPNDWNPLNAEKMESL